MISCVFNYFLKHNRNNTFAWKLNICKERVKNLPNLSRMFYKIKGKAFDINRLQSSYF